MFSPISKQLQPRGEPVEQSVQDVDVGSQRHAIPVFPSLLVRTKEGAKRCRAHESMTQEVGSGGANARMHRIRCVETD